MNNFNSLSIDRWLLNGNRLLIINIGFIRAVKKKCPNAFAFQSFRSYREIVEIDLIAAKKGELLKMRRYLASE